MGFKEDLLRRIDRKKGEIADLQKQIRLAQEYLQALEDVAKSLPKDIASAPPSSSGLRPGTSLAKARDAIRAAGRPMHVMELLTAVGKGNSRMERAGLSGTISAYVRRGEVFTRTGPNTFGLVDMPFKSEASSSEPQIFPDDPEPGVDPEPERVPPSGFGKL